MGQYNVVNLCKIHKKDTREMTSPLVSRTLFNYYFHSMFRGILQQKVLDRVLFFRTSEAGNITKRGLRDRFFSFK